jgi:spore coat protein CotH
MILEKGEKYLLTYNVGNYTEIGTYTGIIHYDDNGIEHRFKVGERSVLVLEEEHKEIKPNLMEELTEGIDTLTEERNMTRDQLLKDYARIIDEQRKEIEQLKESVSCLADDLARMHE